MGRSKNFGMDNLTLTEVIAQGNKQQPKPLQKEPEGAVPDGYRLAPEPKSKRLNLLIRPSVYDALKQNAIVQNVSVNQLINEILQNYIKGE